MPSTIYILLVFSIRVFTWDTLGEKQTCGLESKSIVFTTLEKAQERKLAFENDIYIPDLCKDRVNPKTLQPLIYKAELYE